MLGYVTYSTVYGPLYPPPHRNARLSQEWKRCPRGI